jgi:dystonin
LTRGEEKSVAEDLTRRAVSRSIQSREDVAKRTEAVQPKRVKISDIVVGQEPNVSAKDYLLRWAKRTTTKYPGVNVVDFTKSWRDGLAFSAIIHRNRPDLIDWRSVKSQRASERMESAFYIAEREYGVTRLLDPEGGCWGWVAACPTRLLNLLLLTEQ